MLDDEVDVDVIVCYLRYILIRPHAFHMRNQRYVDASFQSKYFSANPPDKLRNVPGFVPLQLSVDKFILNRTSTTPMDPYVRAGGRLRSGWSYAVDPRHNCPSISSP